MKVIIKLFIFLFVSLLSSGICAMQQSAFHAHLLKKQSNQKMLLSHLLGEKEYLRAQEMITLGADVNSQDVFGSNVLYDCIVYKYAPESIKLLIKNGARVDTQLYKRLNGITILHEAAEISSKEIIETLLTSM